MRSAAVRRGLTQSAETHLQDLLGSWSLPSLATGDLRFGPVVMVGLPPDAAYTDENLLAAQELLLVSGMGP